MFAGQKTYNGVALLSRVPAEDVQIGIPGFEDEQKRVIAGTVAGVRFINLYVVNGQDVDTEKYAYKLRWLAAVRAWIAEELAIYPKLVVLGDFNIAPDARDVHDPTVWDDSHILTSTAERGALQALLDLGLHDAFRLHNEDAGIFSWWDYRAAGFRRDLGLRIDLTLVSDALKPRRLLPVSIASRAPGSAPVITRRRGWNWPEHLFAQQRKSPGGPGLFATRWTGVVTTYLRR